MLIIGELINASRKTIREAIENLDRNYIEQIAKNQAEAGADYIDVNAGILTDREPELLKWLVETVQSAVDLPCCLDSPNPKAIAEAMAVHRGKPIINSISLEKKRWAEMLPLASGDTEAGFIALCMSDDGMPKTADHRLEISEKLIEGLVAAGVNHNDIYVDPLVQPVSVDLSFGVEFLKAVERITACFPEVHTACGLSNVSYGLPQRKLMNKTFISMAISHGLDGAIINPLDREMMANIFTAEVLAGRDPYCSNYLEAFRAGKLAA